MKRPYLVAATLLLLATGCKTSTDAGELKADEGMGRPDTPATVDLSAAGPFALEARTTLPAQPDLAYFEQSPADPGPLAEASTAMALGDNPQNMRANVLLEAPADAQVTESYYVIFWAYQRGNNQSIGEKKHSHTLATFVRVQPTPLGLSADPLTISWMPVSGEVNSGLGASPEPGELTEFDREMRRGARQVNGGLFMGKARAFAWGPFRISAELYRRATMQRDLLSTGQILYKAARRDSARDRDYVRPEVFPKPRFLNCLAAVGDIAPGGGTRVFASSGAGGTRELVAHYRDSGSLLSTGRHPQLIDRHAWLAQLMNLAPYSALYPNGIELEDVQRR